MLYISKLKGNTLQVRKSVNMRLNSRILNNAATEIIISSMDLIEGGMDNYILATQI